MKNTFEMKLIIIGPKFFSYTNAISNEINSRGINCSVFDELDSSSIFTKICYRLNLEFLFKKQILAHREKIYNFIIENNITNVLFISPEIVNSDFLLKINKIAKTHLYMWDGFINKGKSLSVLGLFNTKSSFDMFDCEEHDMKYIPLFAEDEYRSSDVEKIYDISFCGTLHSDRPAWIGLFKIFAIENNLRLGLFLYYYSPVLLFIRLLINKCCFKLFSEVSFVSFSKKDISNLFKGSGSIVDLTHPNQSGLTSRTFEALRSGSKLITNNKNCNFLENEYHSRFFVLDDINKQKLELLNFIESEIKPLTEKQDYFLSIERFSDQLLESLND